MSVDFCRWYLKHHPWAPFRKLLIHKEALMRFREKAAVELRRDHVQRWHQHLIDLKPHPVSRFSFDTDAVGFGPGEDLDPAQHQILYKALRDLMFWRKGPFDYFDIHVDAEWRSNIKWQRVIDLINPDLEQKRICDIGCNNLYYMYRMLPHNPNLVVGIEPLEKYFFHHYLNNLFYQDPRLHFELMGIDDLKLLENFFDVVFCMGILYHRRNPLYSLEAMADSMKSGALLVVETAGIPGGGPYCLFPSGRYMKAPGWWFLPTLDALKNMLSRTGFTDIQVHGVFPSSIEEQRITDWTTKESLTDFLDPLDPGKTVEGYPAAERFYLSARRKRRPGD